jgi:hypothetical protein
MSGQGALSPAIPQPGSRARRDHRLARARAAARYHWNNAGHPLVRAFRSAVDARGGPGPAVLSDNPGYGLSFAYAGLQIGHLNVRQLLERRRIALGGETPVLRTESVSWPDLVRGFLPDADLVLVGAEKARIRQLPVARAFVAPFRVHLVVDTAKGPEAVRAGISRRERWEFSRNSRSHHWTLREDNSEPAFRFFYDRMHMPTMNVRHADDTRTEEFALARDHILRRGRLMFVVDDGQPVAGVLCHERNGTITTRLLGVLDGSAEHYESGAFKAAYHLLLTWAAERGYAAVDFYGTEAFLAKGIFQWKRKFAPRVIVPPNHFSTKRLYLAVRRDSERVRDFLVANPFIEIGADGTMRAVYFHDGVRQARTDISAKAGALAAPRHVDLDEFFDRMASS